MKSLNNFIVEQEGNNLLDSVNSSVIKESLQDSKLKLIAKKIASYDKRLTYFGKPLSFAAVLGKSDIAWDKITDSDWTWIPADDEKGINKAVLSLNSKDDQVILIVKSGQDKDAPTEMGLTGNIFIDFEGKSYVWVDDEMKEIRTTSVTKSNAGKPSMALQLTKNFIKKDGGVWHLDASKYSTFKQRGDRARSKEGMIANDPEDNMKIALANMSRYTKLINKKHAELNSGEIAKISQRAGDVVKAVLDLSKKVYEDPVKYADIQYDIETLNKDIYGNDGVKKMRDPETHKYQTKGYVGVIKALTKVLTYLNKAKKEGDNYYDHEYKRATAELLTSIKQAEKDLKYAQDKLK
jgi:hypothetical protein